MIDLPFSNLFLIHQNLKNLVSNNQNKYTVIDANVNRWFFNYSFVIYSVGFWYTEWVEYSTKMKLSFYFSFNNIEFLFLPGLIKINF